MESPDIVADQFSRTLPESYGQRFSAATIVGHATTAEQRGTAPVGMCVVATDRAGLLAMISDALYRCGFDVSSAEAYTRENERDEAEAVDLFWLHRHNGDPSHLQKEEVDRVRETLLDLWSGEKPAPRPNRRPVADSETSVRFLENANGNLCTLELETADASGLLGVITSALFARGVRITSCKLTTHNGRVFDRFTVTELDGSNISAGRRLEIQVAVISALEVRATASQRA